MIDSCNTCRYSKATILCVGFRRVAQDGLHRLVLELALFRHFIVTYYASTALLWNSMDLQCARKAHENIGFVVCLSGRSMFPLPSGTWTQFRNKQGWCML